MGSQNALFTATNLSQEQECQEQWTQQLKPLARQSDRATTEQAAWPQLPLPAQLALDIRSYKYMLINKYKINMYNKQSMSIMTIIRYSRFMKRAESFSYIDSYKVDIFKQQNDFIQKYMYVLRKIYKKYPKKNCTYKENTKKRVVYSNYYLKNSSFSLCGFSVNSRRNLAISNKSLLK